MVLAAGTLARPSGHGAGGTLAAHGWGEIIEADASSHTCRVLSAHGSVNWHAAAELVPLHPLPVGAWVKASPAWAAAIEVSARAAVNSNFRLHVPLCSKVARVSGSRFAARKLRGAR
jgi:hypothetical protein